MPKVTPLPIEEAQNWLTIEKRLRPMLADLSAEPGEIDPILARVKIVFERCFLDLGWSLNTKGRKERAEWARVKGVIDAITDYHQQTIFALFYEIALREISLYRCSCGKTARAGEDVLRV